MLNVCRFCKTYEGNRILGDNILIQKCAHETNLTNICVMKNIGDKSPAIGIWSYGAAMGYFDIAFCPMCGRKLVEE